MTPKEKAKELYDKFEKIIINTNGDSWTFESKECALLAVDTHLDYSENDSPYGSMAAWIEGNKYWEQVKEEINKL